MEKNRKIQAVVNQITLSAADEADDVFWAKTSAKFRLEELARLRNFYKRFLGMEADTKIQLVLNKTSIQHKMFEKDFNIVEDNGLIINFIGLEALIDAKETRTLQTLKD